MDDQAEIPFFEIGAKVEKRRGYSFPGIVVARFQTMDGRPRYVVEADAPADAPFRGMLHIYSPDQLVER